MISVLTTTIRPEGLKVVRDSLLEQTFTDFEWLVDINWTGKVDFNASMNRLLRRSKGELVVSLQDYIKTPPRGLQSFWDAYKDGQTFVTAPVGICPTLDYENPRWDWRIHKDTCGWQDWEIDWGSAPRQALIDIGGFDEQLDQHWGFDNVNVGLRAKMAGYEFTVLPENKALAYDHNAHIEHPFQPLRNPDFHNQRLDDIRNGKWYNL